ncbi:hypothetical protein N7532_009479 [Penicillium argentinense]|uniref:ABC a-pheromone efflux pump AtrD n=1 Tax=Penicillium argentinense TaxID=1131581 RepID=A0A9W9K2W7_9EURO|nr:uncharacterized protein N7532_009479 [Penicillium argentinense]KAJ5090795.1 hypothetical protein N7532_009479 [Penicillium argentinense]
MSSWKSLFNFTARSHLPSLIIGSIFALLAGCVTPVLAVFFGDVFDAFTVFGAGQIEVDELHRKIGKGCLGMVGLGTAGWFLNGAYYAAFIAFAELQVSTIRENVFIELLSRDLAWFEAQTEGSGALFSGIQAQMQDLKMATSQPLGLIIQYSCRSIASLILGFYTSWSLSLVTLAGIPVFSSIIAYLSTRMKMSITAQQGELTQASKTASNAIANIDTVKCLNGQRIEVRKFSHRIHNAAFYYLRQARLNSLQIAFIRWMIFGMFVQGFWYGSALARADKLTSGQVLRTFWACLTAAQSIEQILPQIIVIEKGKVAGMQLKSIIQTRKEDRRQSETHGLSYPSHCEGDIEVRNVSFAYPSQPDRQVLWPSSFFFPAGETTFVIGKSGSGKSTLGQLLMRFYVPKSGQIFIDGKPLSSLNTHWIRNNITLLEQRSVLFNDTVLQNIAFGSRNPHLALTDQLTNAVDLAALQNTIDGLPKGLDTCVGPGGSFLSGGQRQRLAIARARMRDTPILILDEPTSALDHTSRIAVMQAIREWRKGKTTIIITHDMAQIQAHDFVYILENGHTVYSGYRRHVEIEPGARKYFETERQREPKESKPLEKHLSQASSFYHEGSHYDDSDNTLEDLHPVMPRRARQDTRKSWAQHHLPPSFRTSTFQMASMQYGTSLNRSDDLPNASSNARTSKNSPTLDILDERPPRREVTSSGWLDDPQVRPTGNQMRKMKGKAPDVERADVRSLHDSHIPVRQDSNRDRISHRQSLRHLRISKRLKKQKATPLSTIMGTMIPSLTYKQQFILFLGVISSLAHASATPIFSYCLSKLFATFYAGSDSAKLAMKWSLAVLGVSVGDGLASFFMHYFLEFSGEIWMDTIRNRAFKRIMDQPKAWFEKDGNSAPKLVAYLDQNGEDMRNLLGRFAGYVIVAISITAMAIIWSLIVCWKLTLVALACGPFIYAITRGFEVINGMWERRGNAANSLVFEIFDETFSEIRTVRTLTLEGYFHHKHLNAVSNSLTVGLKRAIYTGLLFGMVESTVIFASALIFYYGGALVGYEYDVNSVMMVFSMLLFSIGYAAQILSWIPQINTSREIASKLLRLAALPRDQSHEHKGHIEATTLTPIMLSKTNFRYPSRPKTLVLKDVSITIQQNSCTAIVGRSGSGKSTIASLILALYEAPITPSGRATVTLGGRDILHLHVPTLRSQIAVVSQQPTLFPGTISDNITYGMDMHSPLTSTFHVRAAAGAAGIDDFISSLPMGYETVVGDGGIGLSDGQKQRLVIARALIRQPQILILDEATSSLDPAGARIVRRTIRRLVAARKNLTVLIITHAKEMIEIADHVVVLDQGVVVEDGSYQELAHHAGGKLYELIHDGNSDV